ncbi:2-amino-4-hydroxy-6-hydroxymethyldihydropteridine diphosphokinase [Palleronia sp. THAF1]|uniref:2-amino-4-hydroxy-6- hydroxymethyldihydropteridine diphosphokinase n=1 Tax=Palleronia sp. THAF1 TaxID=2587842 RepID=UPI0020C7C90C|nr:2-amino-4-hydroxy-6-hydroxymethyldihydropteridine diphosphokinase [Palleronia sp. THAF1]
MPTDQGDPRDLAESAIHQLGRLGRVVRSPFYETPAYPLGSGPDFVNGVVGLDTAISADDLLAALHGIEADAGRTRAERWGPRVLDLDLLAYGDAVLPDAQTQDDWRALPSERQTAVAPGRLILPHPRLQDRAFVLVPWADIAPDWTHPRTGLTVAQMLDALPTADTAAIRPVNIA